jgi:hypothetical protein
MFEVVGWLGWKAGHPLANGRQVSGDRRHNAHTEEPSRQCWDGQLPSPNLT